MSGTEVMWDAIGSGQRKVIRFELPGHGYETGDPVIAAAWAEQCCTAILTTFAAHPIDDLAEMVAQGSGTATEPDEDD